MTMPVCLPESTLGSALTHLQAGMWLRAGMGLCRHTADSISERQQDHRSSAGFAPGEGVPGSTVDRDGPNTGVLFTCHWFKQPCVWLTCNTLQMRISCLSILARALADFCSKACSATQNSTSGA